MTTTDRPNTYFSIDLRVVGESTDADSVLAIAAALNASVQSRSPRARFNTVVRFDPQGLRVLALGRSSQASVRRSALGAAGIFSVDALCEQDARRIENILGPLGLKIVRFALYISQPRRALKGDDPDGFPLLIDSLPVRNSLYPRLCAMKITRVNELTPDIIARFDLERALELHATMYAA